MEVILNFFGRIETFFNSSKKIENHCQFLLKRRIPLESLSRNQKSPNFKFFHFVQGNLANIGWFANSISSLPSANSSNRIVNFHFPIHVCEKKNSIYGFWFQFFQFLLLFYLRLIKASIPELFPKKVYFWFLEKNRGNSIFFSSN